MFKVALKETGNILLPTLLWAIAERVIVSGTRLLWRCTWSSIAHCMPYYVEAVLHWGLSASAKKANTFSRGSGNLIDVVRTWSVTLLIVVSLEIKSR
jgi:hypothetical protein